MVCDAEILAADGLNPDILSVYFMMGSKHLCDAQG